MILLHNLLEAPEDEANDYGLDDETNEPQNTEEDPSTEEEPVDDNSDNEENPDSDNVEEPNPDEDPENPSDEPDDSSSMDDTEPDSETEDETGGEDTQKRRVYILAKSFQKLYNMTDNIITNIDKIEFENDYKISTKNYVNSQLNKMKNVLYDYITITFKTKTYEENLVFIEKYKDTLKILIKTLQKVQESN